jgi:cysteine desulfurase
MAANNVVGAIQPIEELARITRAHGALFHCDAVQAIGKIPLDMRALPVDLLSLSAHKLYGPKGVGALYVRRGVRLAPLIHGGGQERGVRSATENVAGICGLGRAAAIARAEMADDAARLVGMRDRLLSGIAEAVPGVYLFGHAYRRLPGHLCIGLAGHEGEAIRLLLLFDDAGFSLSSGSACSSSHIAEPSAVLLAMGFDPVRARGSLRITLGRFTTDAEVDRFIEIFPRIVGSLTSIYLKPHQQRRQQ